MHTSWHTNYEFSKNSAFITFFTEFYYIFCFIKRAILLIFSIQWVQLYVYNVDMDCVREVTLTPNSAWGGDGCLGCDIGYGYLHRIPVSVDRSVISATSQNLLTQRMDGYKLLSDVCDLLHIFRSKPSDTVPLLAATAQQQQNERSSVKPQQTGIPQVDQLINVRRKELRILS